MKIVRLLAFLFFLSFGTTVFVMQLASPGGESLEHVRVEVRSGESLRDIAHTLKEHGIVRSALAFRWYTKVKNRDTAVRTGIFTIPRNATFAEIIEILSAYEQPEIRITIPEGFTVAQIDARLAERGLIEPGAALGCVLECDFSSFSFLPENSTSFADVRGARIEGYLFPDTYFVDPSEFVAKFFLERMLGTFHARVRVGMADAIAQSHRSLHEIVTMASLIEREAITDEERPIIAGILWKRLDAGRGLDVDATVRYVVQKPTGPLTRSDLSVDSPYNTRKYAGLPPGPIANPGLPSIRAALRPVDTPYWYYLHGADGRIHYAETNEAHNVNKARYL